jgi:hypothetical protein
MSCTESMSIPHQRQRRIEYASVQSRSTPDHPSTITRSRFNVRSMAAQAPQTRPKHATRHACAHACSTPAVARPLTHMFTHVRKAHSQTLVRTHTYVQPSQGIRAPTQYHKCTRAPLPHMDMMCSRENRTLDLRAPPASHSYLQIQIQRAPGLPREARTTVRPTGWVGDGSSEGGGALCGVAGRKQLEGKHVLSSTGTCFRSHIVDDHDSRTVDVEIRLIGLAP